ncbi:hypothetical protein [Streptomyces sp. ISL-98]|uniref:hypothetical protein n=1 Tax=Streptomyces sp. ISL-98 TaxID=2819192 RepID=UPI002554053B|nr:hypothetical protein [Streptomyces sp. ISL-98]
MRQGRTGPVLGHTRRTRATVATSRPTPSIADGAVVATLDLDQLADTTDPLEQAERALLLTVLLEPALLALRRLAQECGVGQALQRLTGAGSLGPDVRHHR